MDDEHCHYAVSLVCRTTFSPTSPQRVAVVESGPAWCSQILLIELIWAGVLWRWHRSSAAAVMTRTTKSVHLTRNHLDRQRQREREWCYCYAETPGASILMGQGGGTRPPNIWTGGHYHECSPQYFWSNISYFLSMQYFLDKLKEFSEFSQKKNFFQPDVIF